jgi:hypothetical protein
MTCRPKLDIQEYDVSGEFRIDSGEVNADLSKFMQARVDELSKKK